MKKYSAIKKCCNRTERTEIATGEIATYVWDYRNRLTRVETKNADGEILSRAIYDYDAFDRRLSKSVDGDGDGQFELTEGFVHNGELIGFTPHAAAAKQLIINNS